MPYSVSVLITNYNYARFLPAAIDSVLAQTRAPLEIIVVDDGSTDDSLQLLQERYADRVQLIAKPNGGQASAFNAGYAASRGDLVCLLDADDTWHPTKVARVVEAYAEHPDAAMVRHDLRFEQPGGPRDGGRVMLITDGFRPPVRPQRALVDRRKAPTSALTFPRWVLDELLPMPEPAFRIAADGYLFILAPTLGPVVDMSAILADYRLHGANGFAEGGALGAERTLRVELDLVGILGARGADPVVPHHIYRAARQSAELGGPLLRERRRLRRTADAARGTGSPTRRLVHAAAELLARVDVG